MNSKNKITAVILTHNDSRTIEKCLGALSWCSEVLIIDDFSQDDTLKLADAIRNKKDFSLSEIKCFKRALNSDFSSQRNFALTKAEGKWVLFVDSDEIMPQNLSEEIQANINSGNETEAFFIKRQDYFLGKWLKHGETGNIKFIRLAKKQSGKWQGRVHENWQIKGNVKTLNNHLLHYSHDNIFGFLKKINEYSSIVAQHWKEQGRTSNLLDIILTPSAKFIVNYLLKFGFLDGTQGFIMAAMMSFHSFLVRSKVFLDQSK